MARQVKNPPAMQETQVWSLVWEDSWRREMATHSSILAWDIPWTEELGRLSTMGSQRVGHNWVTSTNRCLPCGIWYFPLPRKVQNSFQKLSGSIDHYPICLSFPGKPPFPVRVERRGSRARGHPPVTAWCSLPHLALNLGKNATFPG